MAFSFSFFDLLPLLCLVTFANFGSVCFGFGSSCLIFDSAGFGFGSASFRLDSAYFSFGSFYLGYFKGSFDSAMVGFGFSYTYLSAFCF